MAIQSTTSGAVTTKSSDVDPSTRTPPSQPGCGAVAPKWNDKFHLFPELPPEIRQEIWLQAQLEANEDAAGICILGLTMPDKPLAYPYSSPLRSASSESRYIALSHNPSPRPFDPSRDTLYVRKRAFSAFAYRAYYRSQGRWISQIRHLALAVGIAHGGVNLRFMIKIMSSLETLSFVFPSPSTSTSGQEMTVDVRAEVDPLRAGSTCLGTLLLLPDDAATAEDRQLQWTPPPRLRALDSLAVNSIKVDADDLAADYDVCDMVPSRQIRWAKTAKEYLEDIIKLQLRQEDPKRHYFLQSWDEQDGEDSKLLANELPDRSLEVKVGAKYFV